MASYPPPPFSGAPFSPDPRQQARLLRDQARMQTQARKAAYRAQRDFTRQQMRGLRRSSILGPLLLVAVGVVALIVSLGRMPVTSLALWYAHWWPLVLVVAGLVLVAEWAIDQRAVQSGTPAFRRSLGGGAITLLIILFVLGLTARGVHGSDDFILHGLSINPDNIDEIFGNKYERVQQLDQAFPAGTSLAISNPHGDVTISGTSPDDRIHITVDKEVYSSSENLANDKAEHLNPHLELSGSILNLNMPGMDGANSNLNITIPAGAQTTVTADHGDVRVSGLKAPVNVTSNRGDVQLDGITGSVSARLNSSHSSFTSHNVVGDVSLRGHASDVNITDVSGQTSVEGEFFGDTHLERLAGATTFHTNRTYFTLARLAGQIDISPDSELSASDLTGPTELRTRSRNISLQRATGGLTIVNSNGTVDLTSIAPLGGIAVQDKNGSIHLSVPDRAGLTLDATTRDGHVTDEFSPQAVSTGSRSELHGTVGDGSNKVSLETTNGDIAIQRGAASDTPGAETSGQKSASAPQKK